MSAALKEWRRAARAYAANNFESEALLEAGEALATAFTALRSQTLDEAARVAEQYDWAPNHEIQSPTEHQAAVAAAIRALRVRGGA